MKYFPRHYHHTRSTHPRNRQSPAPSYPCQVTAVTCRHVTHPPVFHGSFIPTSILHRVYMDSHQVTFLPLTIVSARHTHDIAACFLTTKLPLPPFPTSLPQSSATPHHTTPHHTTPHQAIPCHAAAHTHYPATISKQSHYKTRFTPQQ